MANAKGFVSVDDLAVIYADGILVGTAFNYGNEERISIPDDTCVIGIHGTDLNLRGGIIGEFNGFVTDESWKCSNRYESGWALSNFDESNWSEATTIPRSSTGIQEYWYIYRQISDSAKWIWTSGWQGQDQGVYCRKVIKSDSNCKDVLANNIVTANDFVVAKVDGNVIAGQIGTVWVDGVPFAAVVEHLNKFQVDVPIDAPVGTTACVIGIEATSFDKRGAILAQFDQLITDSSWKCSNKYTEGWASYNFDDSHWENAKVVQGNGVNDPGHQPKFSASANWIWTSAENSHVFCRKMVGSTSCKVDSLDGQSLATYASIYADGKFIEESRGISYANIYNPNNIEIPKDTCVIALEGSDWGYTVGIIGYFGYILTDESWKCSDTYQEGWMLSTFDDSNWPKATIIHKNGYPLDVAIPMSANYIWSGKSTYKAYCRRVIRTGPDCANNTDKAGSGDDDSDDSYDD